MTIPLYPTVLMSLLLTIALSTGCPPSCICKWRNGKQTVECIGKDLLIIPEGIDTSTQVLDVSGNNLQYIKRKNFLKMGLINLQKLFLSRCGIKIIQVDAFEGLTNLVELDLSENILEIVPTEALINCPSLMKLNLSKNPITSLGRLAFNHLSFLTTLDLSGCEITEVHEAAFSSLYSLEWIDISLNKIRSFPDMRLFPSRLKGVQLQDNPWVCDCRIRSFNFWLKRDIVPILTPPVCREPRRLRGIPVRGLQESELACKPEVIPTSFYFESEEGKNITLLCQVKSVPPAKVSWIFKGQVLQNNSQPIPGLHLVYFIEEGTEEKESSLFIYNLNSENNGTFYCVAENAAGVTSANYTIMIILKHAPIKFEEEPTDFPIDIISILLAAGLVMISLCFVALIMALIKHHTKSKRRRRELEKKQNTLPLPTGKADGPKKSILKSTDNRKHVFVTDCKDRMIMDKQNCQIPEQNPDIINGINSEQDSTSGILLYKNSTARKGPESNTFLPGSTLTMPSQASHHPIAVNPASMNRKAINRQRTQPYLRPTLMTGTCRPVSAPTFERYVESYDLRCTADGYPIRRETVMANCQQKRPLLTQTSYSATTSPLHKAVQLNVRPIEVQTQTEYRNRGVFNDDDVKL